LLGDGGADQPRAANNQNAHCSFPPRPVFAITKPVSFPF
jgi:hypothetical protein